MSVYSSAYSQQEVLLNRLTEQAVTIDSLKRVVIQVQKKEVERRSKLVKLEDSLKKLNSELSALEGLKKNQKSLNDQFKQINDSIHLLSTQLSQKEKLLLDAGKENKKNVTEAKERGKHEALDALINYYLKNTFEVLIQSSTKQSIQKDQQLFGDKTELKSLLSDLEKYFNAKELLNKKYNPGQIQKAQNELNQIKLESVLLSKLKNDLRLYEAFNNGIKDALLKIAKLDEDKIVNPLSLERQKEKYYEISAFIFNFDFNLIDYPYLSEIVLEVIKRKIPSPDAEVSDLIQKLY